MTQLTKKKCVPCEGGMPAMSKEEYSPLLQQVKDWKLTTTDGSDAIEKRFVFKDFIHAMEFVNKAAKLAESEGHHPNFDIRWNKVTLMLWTHAAGGLSENDFILAAKIDRILSR